VIEVDTEGVHHMNENAQQEDPPFSRRLIFDLRPALERVFIDNGMFLDSIEMDAVDDDENMGTISGPQFTFRLQAIAYWCAPKGENYISQK